MNDLNYDIEPGQICVAVNGDKRGHLVTDVLGDGHVFTIPFTEDKWGKPWNRVLSFKLARERYYFPEEIPDWIPKYTGEVEWVADLLYGEYYNV